MDSRAGDAIRLPGALCREDPRRGGDADHGGGPHRARRPGRGDPASRPGRPDRAGARAAVQPELGDGRGAEAAAPTPISRRCRRTTRYWLGKRAKSAFEGVPSTFQQRHDGGGGVAGVGGIDGGVGVDGAAERTTSWRAQARHDVARQQFSFCRTAGARAPVSWPAQAGHPRLFLVGTEERHGWPAFAGHDTGAEPPPASQNENCWWYARPACYPRTVSVYRPAPTVTANPGPPSRASAPPGGITRRGARPRSWWHGSVTAFPGPRRCVGRSSGRRPPPDACR